MAIQKPLQDKSIFQTALQAAYAVKDLSKFLLSSDDCEWPVSRRQAHGIINDEAANRFLQEGWQVEETPPSTSASEAPQIEDEVKERREKKKREPGA